MTLVRCLQSCHVGCLVSFLLILTCPILTRQMSLLSWRAVSGRLSQDGCIVCFLLILTHQILICPMSLLTRRAVSGRLSPVGFPLTERCCRGECQQSGRMMAPDPRFHRSNYSPTIVEEITHRQRWLLPTVGKFPIDSGHLFTPAPTSLLLLRCLSILID